MSKELTVLNGSFEEIAKLTGAAVFENTYLPKLRVNRQATDDDDKPLPMGAFYVTQNANTVYGKSAHLRVFINGYQYVEYDPDEEKFVNRSVIIKNFNEEPLDEQGGKACGKVPFEQQEYLPKEEQMRQKNIKCNRMIYGTVELFEDKDQVLEATPVILKLSGANFMAPKDALNGITKVKHQYFNHMLTLSTTRQKKGSNIFYTINFAPDYKNFIDFSNDDLETFHIFQDVIDRENSFVLAKWRDAVKSRTETVDVAAALDLNDPLDDLLKE